MAHIEDRRKVATKVPYTGTVPWRARYRGPDGRERSQSFARKVDAERWLRDQETAKDRGEWVDPMLRRTTFREWSTEWLDGATHLKPKTRAGYESILAVHVLPELGAMPISAIDQSAVRRFVAKVAAKPKDPRRPAAGTLGAGTARNAYNVVRSVFAVAIGSGAVRVNPCDGVKPPRPDRAEMLFLDALEVERLADAIVAPYGTLVRFAAYTGLRAGEVAALRVGRLDLLRGSVDVREAYSEVHGKLVLGATKTYARRSVALPRFLVDELAAFLVGRDTSPDAHVFTAQDGGPLRHSNFYRRLFKPAVAAAGLPEGLRFHDLRHTCAALLIAQGAHPRALMERLGHSSVTVSLDRYGHLLPSLDETLTAGLEDTYRAALGGAGAASPRPEPRGLVVEMPRSEAVSGL